LAVEAPFPLNALCVAELVNEGRRLAIAADPEVLNVDAVFRQVKIRLILRPLCGRRRNLIRLFVVVCDAIDEQEIGDDHLFKAFQGLLLERLAAASDLGPLDSRFDRLKIAFLQCVEVVALQGVIELIFIGDEMGDKVIDDPLVIGLVQAGQLGDDAVDQLVELRRIFLQLADPRLFPGNLADNVQPQFVEGACGHPFYPRKLCLDPLVGLPAGLSAVGEDQDLIWFGQARLDEIAGLGDYHAGLAATGAGQDQVVVFVDNTGQPLALGERVALDFIEKFLIVGQLSFDELSILLVSDFMAFREQREKLGDNAFLLFRQDIESKRVVQLADQAGVVFPPSINSAVPGIAVFED